MTDAQIRRALGMAMEPIHPEPGFASALFDVLSDELGFRPAARSAASAARRRRTASLTRRLLLVAVLAFGGGAALLTAGGAWRSPWEARSWTDPPNVCELITPDELTAIEGATVRLKQPADPPSGLGARLALVRVRV